jgi:hypothetical protein
MGETFLITCPKIREYYPFFSFLFFFFSFSSPKNPLKKKKRIRGRPQIPSQTFHF